MSYKNELQNNNVDLQSILEAVNNLPDAAEDAVLYAEQSLTEEQKAQARENIGALAENQGVVNVGKILVVGADGNLTLTDMPSGTSGDVIGMIDANNNIVITGALTDGTYVFKYENADGTYAEIGSLVVGGVVEYAITANLTNCTGASGNATVIEENGTVTLTFTANDDNALPENVTVSGAGYTWDATTGKLVLSNPTADVVITIVATKSGYTNIIDTVGYTDGVRLSSSGSTSAMDGYTTTGMIDISAYEAPVIIRTNGVNFTYTASCYMVLYKADGTKITHNPINSTITNGDGGWNNFTITADADGNIVITKKVSGAADYFRIAGYGSGANLIVTINEEIMD